VFFDLVQRIGWNSPPPKAHETVEETSADPKVEPVVDNGDGPASSGEGGASRDHSEAPAHPNGELPPASNFSDKQEPHV
jgi:hypothetical protein